MPYYVAIPEGDKFIIASREAFQIRSNALAYAKRMGWEKICFIATSEQRAMIEAGTYGEASANSYAEIVNVENVEVISPPEPDVKWMKDEGILWDKKLRKPKKK